MMSDMSNARAAEAVRQLSRAGGPLDYGPDRSRLVVRLLRMLAQGHPLSGEQVGRVVADLGIAPDDEHELLRAVTERDAAGNVVGLLGLSLNETPHRFSVNGRRLSTWCALDALFLPTVLEQSATVESESPATNAPVRVRVSSQRLEDVSPAGTVVSVVVIDPAEVDTRSVEALWGTFCHHVHFFASRDEAEQWAAGRADIEILTVEEGHEAGRQISARVLAYGS